MDDDLKDLIARAVGDGPVSTDALERTKARIRRRERNRRSYSAVLALALAAGATIFAWEGFRSRETPLRPEHEGPTVALSPHVTATVQVGTEGNVNSVVFGIGSVWVSGIDQQGEFLARVDPDTNDIAARIAAPTAGWTSGGGGIAIGNNAVWAAGDVAGSAVVERIDPTTNMVSQTVELGHGSAVDVALDQTGLWILVADSLDGNRIVKLDPQTGEIVTTIPLELGWVRRILPVGNVAWVYGRQTNSDPGVGDAFLVKVDVQTNAVVDSSPTAFEPFAFDGKVLWATGEVAGSPAIVQLDPSTGAERGTPTLVTGSLSGAGLVVGEGGVWFASFNEAGVASINRLNVGTGTVDVSTSLGAAGQVSIAISPQSLWLLNATGVLVRADIS